MKALRPLGYPDVWMPTRKGKREYHHSRKEFTVEFDPEGTFKPGAKFGVYEVTNKERGMLMSGCFVNGTLLLTPDKRRVKVVNNEMLEVK